MLKTEYEHQLASGDRWKIDFTKHKAKYNFMTAPGFKIGNLTFRVPGSSYYYLSFTLINGIFLSVNGDLGAFSFHFPESRTLTSIALSDDSYIAGKCTASEDGRKPEVYSEDEAKKNIREIYCDPEDGNDLEVLNQLSNADISSEYDYFRFLENNSDLFDISDISDCGKVLSVQYLMMRSGLLAACEKMGWLEKENAK